jgi:hypothetical protein
MTNLILARESNPNTPEYKRRLEEQAQAKAQAEEQRKNCSSKNNLKLD